VKVKKVVIGIAVAIFVILLVSPYILQPFEVPLNTFLMVSNQGSSYTCIVLVSWYGCPYGATDSWVLLDFLSHYGKLTYNLTYSDPNDVYPNTPGVIFTSFVPNSTIHFKFLYLYNRYLNATANGTVVSNYVSYGLSMIKQELPQYYDIIQTYVTQKWASGSFFQPATYLGNPPHIPTLIIVSGKNGIYMLIGHLIDPAEVNSYNSSYLLTHYSQLSFIQQGYDELQQIVNESSD